jgi:hypothetical protein
LTQLIILQHPQQIQSILLNNQGVILLKSKALFIQSGIGSEIFFNLKIKLRTTYKFYLLDENFDKQMLTFNKLKSLTHQLQTNHPKLRTRHIYDIQAFLKVVIC